MMRAEAPQVAERGTRTGGVAAKRACPHANHFWQISNEIIHYI
jgi:hypothetical protein